MFKTYIWATTLVYDPEALPWVPTHWSDFWDLAAFPGQRGLRRSARLCLELALLADGVKAGQVYATLRQVAGVNRAFRKLDQIRSHIQWWEAGAQPLQWLASGEVSMAAAYTARSVHLRQQALEFPLPWRGRLYDMDSWGVVKGVEHQVAAQTCIAFAGSSQQQALFAWIIHGWPSHSRALRVDHGFWLDHGQALEERFNHWAAY
ncbi:extracellular solute-binding protein [Pseudomonas sp. NFXW11]|uniref:extracellular solute-binding protein n=1 Tax=Pseudomonas sp. NFXW11 TaxID=2819531 RepID=UPI003CFB7044